MVIRCDAKYKSLSPTYISTNLVIPIKKGGKNHIIERNLENTPTKPSKILEKTLKCN